MPKHGPLKEIQTWIQNFLEVLREKHEGDIIRNYICSQGGIQNFSTGREDRGLQLFGHVHRVDRIRIRTNRSQLKFKGKRPME
jgi:hypothetical protein